jgi:urea carboxylase system permease
MAAPAVDSDDDRDLAREGYRPEFRRALGSFTAFAAGFSYLSILTGITQNFYLGYREAGPACVWTWPVVFAGQLCLALCFAELARLYPFCGGIYAWSRRAGSPFVGWLTGWVYLASLIVTLAAVALACQIVLPSIWSGFEVMPTGAQNAAVFGAILIAISTVLNVVGTRWLAAIMNAGVVIELVAAVVLVILLAVHAVRSPAAIVDVSSVSGSDVFGPLLAAAVMSAYVMYGFDTAGTLAEETVRPRRRAPWAILQALAAAALLGGLLLVFAVTGAPDLADPELAKDSGGLPYLIKQVLGEGPGNFFLVAAAVAILVCTLAVHANTARVLFAMARDRSLPGAQWLGHIYPDQKSPLAAAVVVGVLAAGLLIVNIDFEKLMTALVCVAIVWANLAYLLTTGPQLLRRRRQPGGDSFLGSWGRPVNVFAVVWGALLIVDVGWPRARFYGDEWYEQYAAPLFTGLLLVVGGGVFAVFRPHRPGELS